MSKLKFISPYNIKEEQYEDYISWNGVYFHGIIEDYIGSIISYEYPLDLVQCNKYSWKYKEGIYDAFCYDKPVKLYLWRFKISTQYEYTMLRGLIVDPTSAEDVKYAEEHFNLKSKSL